MRIIEAVHSNDFKSYGSERIRENFHIGDLFKKDELNFTYTHYDRMMVGGVLPAAKTISLETYLILRAEFFLERRELGIINVGGKARITAGDKDYEVHKLDCLYVGKGTGNVSFASLDSNDPAVLYLLSAPAHAVYPTTLLKKENADSTAMGSKETANERTIYRYIHLKGIQSSQLVMGLTLLAPGSVWNTIPPHVHDRRMEVYFYFDLPHDQVIFHYMGQPSETRHVMVKNYDAVVSPPWSIHAGCGTSNYGFIWGMAGENLEYGDMDPVPVSSLR